MSKFLITTSNRACVTRLLVVAIPLLEKQCRTNKHVIRLRAMRKFDKDLKNKISELKWWQVYKRRSLKNKISNSDKYWFYLTYKEAAREHLHPAQQLLDTLSSPCFLQVEVESDFINMLENTVGRN